MTSTLLVTALTKTIIEAIERSSDGIVRVDIGADVPITESLREAARIRPDIVIGLLDQRHRSEFENSGISFEDDPKRLTRLRNDRSRKHPLIFIGAAIGIGQQGLRDVGTVVDLADLKQNWRTQLKLQLSSNHSDRDLEIRLEVVDAMFSLLDDQLRTVQVIDKYLDEAVTGENATLTDLQQSLWRVGLLPDEHLISSSISTRIKNNLDTIEYCLEDTESGERLRARLAISNDPRVQHFLTFIEKSSSSELAHSDLMAVQEAMRLMKPIPSKRENAPLLLEVLSDDSSSRMEILQSVAESLPDFEERAAIDVLIKTPSPVRILVQGGKDQTGSWILDSQDVSGLDTSPENQVFTTLRLTDGDGRVNNHSFSIAYLAEALKGRVDASVIDRYATSRAELLKIAYFLGSDDAEVLTLLVASPDFLAKAESYVDSWQRLLDSFAELPPFESKANLGIFLALGDAIWSRELGSHESFDDPVVSLSDIYSRANLASFHPWRLDPLVVLAGQVRDRLFSDASVAAAAAWAIDRAVPSFRVLRIGVNRLSYTTSTGGSCEFTFEPEDALPPISSKVPEIERTLSAYLKTHPWAEAGATVVIANPPGGGFLRRTTETLGRLLNHTPQTFVVRERSAKGVDHSIQSSEFLEVVDTDRLTSSAPLAELGRDLTVLFLAGFQGKSQALTPGSYGPIDLELASFGLGKRGQVYIPRINLRPDERNATISLLHKVSGVEGVTAAFFDLALPPTALEVIPTASTDTQWIVIAAPSFVSSFPVKDLSERKLHPLTEFDDGNYRFFVYARTIEPLGIGVQDRMLELPITSPHMAEVRELVNSLAETLPEKVFDIALNRFGSEEALGLINARAIARANVGEDELALELSLDHAGWTQQLTSGDNRRADLLMVRISSDPAAETPIQITVVEAKATTDPFYSPRPDREPFTEAIRQTESTREFLIHILASAEEGLIESIQLRALIEQLASRAASEYTSSKDPNRDATFKVYFEHISALSTPGRRIPPIDSLAVVTFLDGIQDLQYQKDGDVRMISASSKLLEQVLRNQPFTIPAATTFESPEPPIKDESASIGRTDDPSSSARQPKTLGNESPNYTVSSESLNATTDENEAPATGEVIDAVTRTLRLRSEKVGKATEAETSLGPTFMAISLPFERGASLAPLQRSESDIARDLGVSSVEIGNDTQVGRIRVLVPRPKRLFPELPEGDTPIYEGSQYLPFLIGQGLNGDDFFSPLSSWPHALVAGSTGSGKTTFLRSILTQLDRWGAERANVVIVDGKGETDYFGTLSEKMFVSEFSEPQLSADDAVSVLDWLTESEVPRRKKLMLDLAREQVGRTDAKALYLQALRDGTASPIQPLVVVIDEFNEIMIRGGASKERFVTGVTSVAQTARSVLVHLVLATQRPDRTVVPGAIKANLPARFAFRLPTASDSVTVLGHGGAERLLGWGDMLLQLNGEADRRLQSFMVS
jgi:S-DNA-T family DNA segregation ATPase FtsK/SpoIIIE